MTQTGPSSGIGAHCPEAIGGCCRAFLLRAVVRRGGKLSYRFQFFSPAMKTVCAELRGDGYVKHIARRRSSSEVLALVRALRVSRWINVRRGACEAQAIVPETQAPFSQSYFGGKDSRLARVAGVLVGMDCHYLNNPCPASFPYNGGSGGEWAMLATDQNCCQKNFV